MKRLQLGVKRVIDVTGSALGLFILAPILVLVSLLVRITMGKPVLFRQERPGKNEKLFVLYKFRTMTDARGPGGKLLPDGERLTCVGRFLRRWSLDELPQLWNVLRGDMSLVGPRPQLKEYLGRYSPEQRRRHDVKPGITGWAQVNGRNVTTWEDRFRYDVWYVDNWNSWLDLKILLVTTWKILKREGISQPGWATMEEFTGSNIHDADGGNGVAL